MSVLIKKVKSKKMVLAFSTCMGDMFMRGILSIAKKMEVEKLLILMGIHITVNGVMDRFLDLEFLWIRRMAKVLKVFGETDSIAVN